MSEIIFILGGAESGKSSFGVRFFKNFKGKVGFVATCVASDPEMKIKIKKHKNERPLNWITFESAQTPFKVNFDHQQIDSLLIDSLTLWVSSLMLQNFKKEDANKKNRRICKDFFRKNKTPLSLGQRSRCACRKQSSGKRITPHSRGKKGEFWISVNSWSKNQINADEHLAYSKKT